MNFLKVMRDTSTSLCRTVLHVAGCLASFSVLLLNASAVVPPYLQFHFKVQKQMVLLTHRQKVNSSLVLGHSAHVITSISSSCIITRRRVSTAC